MKLCDTSHEECTLHFIGQVSNPKHKCFVCITPNYVHCLCMSHTDFAQKPHASALYWLDPHAL